MVHGCEHTWEREALTDIPSTTERHSQPLQYRDVVLMAGIVGVRTCSQAPTGIDLGRGRPPADSSERG